MPRFARPCGLFWLKFPVKIRSNIESVTSLRSTMWIILVKISGQDQIKNSIDLPRFGRPCGLFWLQLPVKFTAKFRNLSLASLDHVIYFGSNLLFKSDQKFDRFASIRDHVVYFDFNLPLNSQQNFETSVSLRSTMWFISAQISGQHQIKNSIALPRFARLMSFISA